MRYAITLSNILADRAQSIRDEWNDRAYFCTLTQDHLGEFVLLVDDYEDAQEIQDWVVEELE